jgi:hypothetical protein
MTKSGTFYFSNWCSYCTWPISNSFFYWWLWVLVRIKTKAKVSLLWRWYSRFWFGFGFMVFNATFNNISVISWRSVLLEEETGVHRENHDLSQVTDKLSHIMLYRVYDWSDKLYHIMLYRVYDWSDKLYHIMLYRLLVPDWIIHSVVRYWARRGLN